MSYSSILITGASSGIGAALALAFAAPGHHLTLTGRDEARLNVIAEKCRAKGATITARAVDVQDEVAMRALLCEVDQEHPFDLVIANAGISLGYRAYPCETLEDLRRLFNVNVFGLFNTLLPLLENMQQRGRGHLALMSSMAAFYGFPGSAGYCATKAAVKNFGQALQHALHPSPLNVTLIYPGFVESRITAQNTFPMPFLMTVERAAHIIKKGLLKRKKKIAFPLPMILLSRILEMLPTMILDKLFAKAFSKNSALSR